MIFKIFYNSIYQIHITSFITGKEFYQMSISKIVVYWALKLAYQQIMQNK